MSKQSKYTKSARGKECQVRIPFVCNHDPETTVFAHLNGGGMGAKNLDIHGSYACSNCHDAIDGRRKVHSATRKDIKHMFLDGMVRTQKIMVEEGLLVL